MRSGILLGMVGCLLPGALAAWLIIYRPDVDDVRYVGILTGLISGSIVAAAIFLAESVRERRAAVEGEQQAVRIQLALTRDLSGADIRGRDLRHLDLRGKTIRNANLQNCNLSGMDLSDTDFRGSNLRAANLKGSLLTYSDLRFVDARKSSFRGANLIFADLRGGLFGGCDMQRVDGQGADCRAVSLEDYIEMRSSHSIRFRSRVSGVEWTPSEEGYRTRLDGVLATGSSWRGARFDNADLDRSDFSFSTFGADFPRSLTIREDWRLILRSLLNTLKGRTLARTSGWQGGDIPTSTATFAGASVDGAVFEGCSGPGIAFTENQVRSCKVPVPEDARRITA